MVVMVAAGVDPLVAGDPPRRLEALHEPQLLEHLERPVDARATDPDMPPPQLLLELERGHRAAVAGESLDDGGAGATAPVAGPVEARQGVVGPGAVDRSCHQPIVASV